MLEPKPGPPVVSSAHAGKYRERPSAIAGNFGARRWRGSRRRSRGACCAGAAPFGGRRSGSGSLAAGSLREGEPAAKNEPRRKDQTCRMRIVFPSDYRA